MIQVFTKREALNKTFHFRKIPYSVLAADRSPVDRTLQTRQSRNHREGAHASLG